MLGDLPRSPDGLQIEERSEIPRRAKMTLLPLSGDLPRGLLYAPHLHSLRQKLEGGVAKTASEKTPVNPVDPGCAQELDDVNDGPPPLPPRVRRRILCQRPAMNPASTPLRRSPKVAFPSEGHKLTTLPSARTPKGSHRPSVFVGPGKPSDSVARRISPQREPAS